MNKFTFKLLVGSFVALGAAAFTLGVVNELRTIKTLTVDADPDEVAEDEEVTVEVLADEEEAEEAPVEEVPVEEVPAE